MKNFLFRSSIGKKTAIVTAFMLIVSFAVVCLLKYQIKIVVNDIEIGYGKDFVDDMTASFMGKDVTGQVIIDGFVDTHKLGEYTITYTWFLKRVKRKVIVIDNEPPKISLIGDKKITLTYLDLYNEQGVKAIDDYDGDITSEVQKEILEDGSNYTVKYSVKDSSGNLATKVRKIIIEAGTVYLTFDDGPSLATSEYIKVLNDCKVKATFFINGFGEDEKSWKVKKVKEIISAGNTIGMHGYTHSYSEAYASVQAACDNFFKQRNELIDNGIEPPMVIRFPGGSSNTISRQYCEGVMSEATRIMVEEGYNYFDWNVDSRDSGEDVSNSDKICENVINSIYPGGSYVVLLHDGENHEATLEALPRIIEILQKKGYKFDVITDETPPIRHGVNN